MREESQPLLPFECIAGIHLYCSGCKNERWYEQGEEESVLHSLCGSHVMLCLQKILTGNSFKPYFLLRLHSALLQKFPLKGRMEGRGECWQQCPPKCITSLPNLWGGNEPEKCLCRGRCSSDKQQNVECQVIPCLSTSLLQALIQIGEMKMLGVLEVFMLLVSCPFRSRVP